ncbi:MAG TPA: PqqD family protein, partial [Usitatibacter sp.]|nr:PqqD family protein [Usitatibacter sp.]
SSLFSLNETAAALWDAADGATSLESIVDNVICERFEVSREEALADAEALAEELARHGILEISDSPITPR